MLPSGASLAIEFGDGIGYCLFDFRAVFLGRGEQVSNGVNVCETGGACYH